MAGSEDTYDPANGRVNTRETLDSADVAKASKALETSSYAPGAGPGGPKREEFPEGLTGTAAYSKALANFRRVKAAGQAKAMGAGSD